MSIQYYPQPVLSPMGSGSGGYDFGYGGGNYGWNSGTGYYPYGSSPFYSAPTTHTVVQPVIVRPPQQVGQQYVNTAPKVTTTQVAPAPKPEDFLPSDKKVENWGDSERVVAKDAPEGLARNLLGVLDWATFGIGDFDKRGNLYGGVHKPGLRPGSGYGGNVSDTPIPPQPQPPKAETVPNQPLPDDPRNTNTGQLKHFGMNALLSQADAFLTGQRMQAADDRAFNNLIRTRQWLDPNNINFITRQQMTPFGKSRLLNEATARTQALTSAATDAANRKLALRQGLLAMKQGAIGTATAGLNRTYAPGIG